MTKQISNYESHNNNNNNNNEVKKSKQQEELSRENAHNYIRRNEIINYINDW